MSELNEKLQLRDMLQRVRSYVGSKPIIIEAGAHNGSDTVNLAEFFDEPTIFAFEPMPDQYNLLCNKVKKYINVFTEQVALAADNKDYDFYVSSGKSDASSSILKPKKHLEVHPDVRFDEIIKVKGINLDSWCHENKVSHIDFMWLDMQGAEYSVLSSSPQILKTTKAIYTEVSLIETYSDVPLFPIYKKFLETAGFKLTAEYLNWNDMGNVLFLKS